MPRYTFKEAAEYRISLPKYKGQTLDVIAETDEGLKYLDWLYGQDIRDPFLKAALRAYMEDPAIKAEREKL